MRDLELGTTTRVNLSVGATVDANGDSTNPQVGPDGSWVDFESDATTLVSPVSSIRGGIFVWTKSDQQVRRLAAGPTGAAVNAVFDDLSVSRDQDLVVFSGVGINLLSGVASPGEVYLARKTNDVQWELQTLRTSMKSIAGLSNAMAFGPVLSGDSRFLFFYAAAQSNSAKISLARADLSNFTAMMVATNLDNFDSRGQELVGPSVGDDGQFAAFVSSNTISRWSAVSGLTNVPPQAGLVEAPVISPNGRFVVFRSSAAMLEGLTNGGTQLYIRDLETGVTDFVSRNEAGQLVPEIGPTVPIFSTDNEGLLLDTEAPNLVENDRNEGSDVFVWSRTNHVFRLISETQTARISMSVPGPSGVGSVSPNGRYIAFRTGAPIDAADTNTQNDVYLFDRTANTNILISITPEGAASGRADKPVILSGGEKVAFESLRGALGGVTDTRVGQNIYLRNVTNTLLENISGSTNGDVSIIPGAPADRFIFSSLRVNAVEDLYRFDVNTGARVLGGRIQGLTSASADGETVAYAATANGVFLRSFGSATGVSAAGGIAPVISGGGMTLITFRSPNLFVTNRLTHQTNSFPATNKPASLSADGRIIAYTARAPGVTKTDVYFYDQLRKKSFLVSRALGQAIGGNGNSECPVVSADGRFIAFESFANDLCANDKNVQKDIFVYDRASDETALVSQTGNGFGPGNSGSFNPLFTQDGTNILFVSFASDLATNDVNQTSDLFLYALNRAVSSGDLDGDTLADAWERLTFSSLEYGPQDDPDGDGLTIAQEIRAGTDPIRASSNLAIVAIDRGENGSLIVRWNSVIGKRYRLEFISAVDSSNWNPAAPETEATAATTSAIDSSAGETRYYRIRLAE